MMNSEKYSNIMKLKVPATDFPEWPCHTSRKVTKELKINMLQWLGHSLIETPLRAYGVQQRIGLGKWTVQPMNG
jgi:hypothetical protein